MFLFMVHEMQCLVHVSLSHSITVMRFQSIGTVTLKGYCYNPMPFRSAIDWSLFAKILIQLTSSTELVMSAYRSQILFCLTV